jgi:hypothetical protein
VASVNDAPVATDTMANGVQNAASIALSVTGTDADGTIASVTLTSLPANGTLYTDAGLTTLAAINTAYPGGSKSLYFVPNANFSGVATFNFTVTDDQGATDATPATATINVAAKPGGGDPGGDPGGTTNSPPVNTLPPVTWQMNEDTTRAMGGFAVSDANGDTLTTTLSVAHGTLSLVGADGSSGVTGNGTATLVITGTAAQVNARLAALSYTPAADYNGSDTLTITTSDGKASDVDAMAIDIKPVSDIVPDSLSTDQGTAVTANLVRGGSGADNFEGTPVVTAVTQGQHGSVSIGAGGNVTYTPASGYSGPDSFTYTVTSGGVTETATVTVEVKPTGGGSSGGDTPRDGEGFIQAEAGLASLRFPVDGTVIEGASLTYVEPVIRAMQAEARQMALQVEQAATEADSPLFDDFGFSAPQTEFVPPVPRATQSTAQAETDPHPVTAHQAAILVPQSERAAAPAPRGDHDMASSTPVRRAAESFSAQLHRAGDAMRGTDGKSLKERRARPRLG